MTNGTVTGNKTEAGNGGGIYVTSTGDSEISGGSLTSNTAAYGGAVYVAGESSDSYADVKLSGGEITANTASTRGGGVYVQAYGQVNMTGGEISTNNATTGGGGVYITAGDSGNGVVTMTGGTITGNTITNTTVTDGMTEGHDVHVAGKLSMGADAYVESLYVISTSTVTFNSQLNARENSTEVVISTTRYGSTSTQYVLDSSSSYTASNYYYFKLPERSDYYYITSTGAISNSCVARVLQADTNNVYKHYTTLQLAIDAAPTNASQATNVQLVKDMNSTEYIDIVNGKNILLTDDGNGACTIKRTAQGHAMFQIRSGATLTLSGSANATDASPTLIISGENLAASGGGQSIVKVGTSASPGGTFVLKTGVKLQNNNNGGDSTNANYDGYGGAVYISPTGKMTMEGGTITGCSSGVEGGAILIRGNGTFTMTGGTISNNTASRAGGAICHMAWSNTTNTATVSIEGGKITSNTSSANGGAIFMHAAGTLNVSGGEITGNSGTNSGGIYLHYNSTNGGGSKLIMSGGSIDDNKILNTTTEANLYVVNGSSYELQDGATLDAITDNNQ